MGPRHFCRGIFGIVEPVLVVAVASMGPRHFCRGIALGVPTVGRTNARFNGATAFLPWNPTVHEVNGKKFIMLQWGHGISAVESSCPQVVTAASSSLQWGHGISAVESKKELCQCNTE